MTTYSDDVREKFRDLDTDDLRDRLRAGALTAEAHAIALEELASRGIATIDIPRQPVAPDHAPPPPGFFARSWRGKERLWKAFWLVGLLIVLLLSPLRVIENRVVLAGYLLLVALPAHIFWWVSVWRCAFRASHWLWSILARAWVVLGVVFTIYALGSIRV